MKLLQPMNEIMEPSHCLPGIRSVPPPTHTHNLGYRTIKEKVIIRFNLIAERTKGRTSQCLFLIFSLGIHEYTVNLLVCLLLEAVCQCELPSDHWNLSQIQMFNYNGQWPYNISLLFVLEFQQLKSHITYPQLGVAKSRLKRGLLLKTFIESVLFAASTLILSRQQETVAGQSPRRRRIRCRFGWFVFPGQSLS
jgi:hypothetical protein